ncbi:MAG: hypothetical protein RL223_4604 [Pseudomonadota bacterium]
MSPTPEHGRLAGLLNYLVEQGRTVDPRAWVLGRQNDFRRLAEDLEHLPGVRLDDRVSDDPAWLTVERLQPAPPPQPDEEDQPWIVWTDRPDGAPPRLHELALAQRRTRELTTMDPPAATLADRQRRERVACSLAVYAAHWQAWATAEAPRRRAIALYGELFALRERLQADETAQPSELVWGLGLSAWRLDAPATAAGLAGAGMALQYPLLTQAVEIELDPADHTITVRPRATGPRLEFDAFSAAQVPHAAEVERQARQWLADEMAARRNPDPFAPDSVEPLLRLTAGGLDRHGVFEPLARGLPEPGPQLRVTGAWVLFMRPRPANVLIEDIQRLTQRIAAGDPLPAGPAALVTPPSDEVPSIAPIAFRGLCSGSGHVGEPRELFFPLPYNQEQETIIEMLERSPGVSVQGPPGTGKTHTIANIICHYLATGRTVLVTAKGEHALAVLQDKIPPEVRPLTVALLAGDKEGLRQFQASIEAIVHTLSQLDPRASQAQIARTRQAIDAAHAEIAGIDRRIDAIAARQLAPQVIDGQTLRAQEMAELAVDGAGPHGWFTDALTMDAAHAPPLSEAQAQALREARRRLGPDLVYAEQTLPASESLPTPADLAELHEQLRARHAIEDAQATGELPALRTWSREVVDDARRLLAAIEQALPRIEPLDTQAGPWWRSLRERCRRPDFASECQALQLLLGELDTLVAARAAFLQRPVTLPEGVLGQPQVAEALQRGAQTGKPFGAFTLGRAEAKARVAAIRVSGLPPEGAGDWTHVLRHVSLHGQLVSFAARWSAVARELGIPEIDAGIEQLRATERLGLAVRQVHALATQQDAALAALSRRVFLDLPERHLLGEAEDLKRVAGHLRRHLGRVDIAQAARTLAEHREALAGCGGPVVERLRARLAEGPGQRTLAAERLAADWSDLMAELRRIEQLRPELDRVAELTARIEQSGAPDWAQRLRRPLPDPSASPSSSGADGDPALPARWREAWTWARLRHHLQGLDAREEQQALARRRRALEQVLARQYTDLVSHSAWLQTKANASAKVLSALESYRVAIRRIGQGTGTHAPRYRRDARQAMLDAQAAVPCWIMSHAKVSESMPAELGRFDLVIVDEASQSDLWALPAVLRGRQVLVVGDDKQVSPTAGFLEAAHVERLRQRFLADQPHARDLTPEKSLYDLASTVYAAHRVMLTEHFRCAEPIIAYSNRTFYQDQIRPLRIPHASERLDPPLVDLYLPAGVRDARNINAAEAECIVQQIEALVADPAMAGRSIGVVSLLGPEQARHIHDLACRRIDMAELTRRRFTCGDAYVFQGSERDIMFLSLVADAKQHARDRMVLVRSVTAAELSPRDVRRGLVEHFSGAADAAPAGGGIIGLGVGGGVDGRMSDGAGDGAGTAGGAGQGAVAEAGGTVPAPDADTPLIERCESGFERDVYSALTALGYRVTPQVRAGAYRIDLVVEGAGDRRLAIECDGDAFHGPDRWPADMARQRVLERAGWTFWRCFASTWTLRRAAVLQELQDRLQALDIAPLGAVGPRPGGVEQRVWPPRAAA